MNVWSKIAIMLDAVERASCDYSVGTKSRLTRECLIGRTSPHPHTTNAQANAQANALFTCLLTALMHHSTILPETAEVSDNFCKFAIYNAQAQTKTAQM